VRRAAVLARSPICCHRGRIETGPALGRSPGRRRRIDVASQTWGLPARAALPGGGEAGAPPNQRRCQPGAASKGEDRFARSTGGTLGGGKDGSQECLPHRGAVG
jgi:hypothetical protein